MTGCTCSCGMTTCPDSLRWQSLVRRDLCTACDCRAACSRLVDDSQSSLPVCDDAQGSQALFCSKLTLQTFDRVSAPCPALTPADSATTRHAAHLPALLACVRPLKKRLKSTCPTKATVSGIVSPVRLLMLITAQTERFATGRVPSLADLGSPQTSAAVALLRAEGLKRLLRLYRATLQRRPKRMATTNQLNTDLYDFDTIKSTSRRMCC